MERQSYKVLPSTAARIKTRRGLQFKPRAIIVTLPETQVKRAK